jgi:Zn-dependent M16 (insulinase) family peptidase
LYRQSQRCVFPDNTYSVDSGGDPKVIPDLSFEDFKAFHEKFYHPANSRIFFWGDDNVQERLELMDEYLSEFGESPESKPGSVVQWQKKTITEPKWETFPYPIGADQPETNMIMVNWLLNERPFTPTEDLIVGVLDHLLMGTSQSVLYKTMMESGLGSAITGGGLSDELLQATFSVGLKGVESENAKSVEELVLKTLDKVMEDGFSEEEIASAMNTIEFRLREFNTGSYPKGLSFMLGAMSKWIYDGQPTDALKFEEPLAELKEMIAKDGDAVFKNFLKDYLVDNMHRVTVELAPSKTLEEEELKEEQSRLSAIKSSLSDDELDNIIKQTEELKALQASEDAPEDRATIPSLELADLKREVTEYPNEVTENENNSGVTVVRHELQSTSGIAYVKFAIDTSGVDYDDIALLPLFTRIMTETGAGDYSDVQLSQRIGTHTGGVGASLMKTGVAPDGVPSGAIFDGANMITKLTIGGKATSEKADELFSIFKLILTEANLDSKKKVVEMLKETKIRIESSIQGSGHSYSNTRMKARYSIGGFLDEKMGGLTYLETITALLKEAEEDWDSVLARLENIRAAILNKATCRNGMILDITGDKAVQDAIKPAVDSFLDSLPGDADGEKLQDFYNTEHPWATKAKEEMTEAAPLKDEGFVVPTQVSYVGKGGLLFEEGEKVPGSTAVVSRYLRTGYLWDHVRVMGGAYGGFCTFNPMGGDGVFTFLSYRDPNLDKTIDVYDATADALLAAAEELENNQDALATAIIGAVGDLDGALSPDQKGSKAFNRWLVRQTPEERQTFRDEILNTKASDFKDFAMRLKNMKKPSVAVVSSKAAFEAAAEAGKVMDLKQVV